MANVAKTAILRAKLEGVLTDLMVKTITDNVYYNDTTTLTAHLATLAKKADLETLQDTVNALGALAQKDKVSQADLDTALAALINGKAAQTDLDALKTLVGAIPESSSSTTVIGYVDEKAAAATYDDTALSARVTAVEGKASTLIGSDAGKSARTIANEELAAQLIPDSAKESLDTLSEIAAWIQAHPDDASAMNQAITALQNQLTGIDAGSGTVKKYVDDAIAALKIGDYAKAADLTALAGRVTTAEGKITALENTVNGLGDLATKDIVTEADLDSSLAEKVNSAAEGNHSHANKAVIDGITSTKVSAWDDAAAKAHEHTNKSVIDGITADLVTAWNGKSKIFYSATEPAALAEGDLWVQIVG